MEKMISGDGLVKMISCKHAMRELIRDLSLSYENEMLAKSSHTDSSSPVDLFVNQIKEWTEGNEDSSLLEAIYEPLMRLQN
ncbi:uncharacterized protein LOC108827435 [Raphanus sativus]|uniref:Uncharacterized protein LOC108827435 n=1 Tax=Raphanus sativus TaxID=3726 RepID=A0A9W3CEW0_RAPSA|nr:uncharacterized protein LOC108827435 [Raphanus sativus]XP_056849978.1 uncharacterized protein LOC108827435 [Raphanus sativus]XP_056849979.1 uncharacterized protein LOC108827435 [Raphanus sativus]